MRKLERDPLHRPGPQVDRRCAHSPSPRRSRRSAEAAGPVCRRGAIPLEALRLGCEANAVELNPVTHLIELCTLIYSQKYGQPNSRPVPDYIKRLISHNKATKQGRGQE